LALVTPEVVLMKKSVELEHRGALTLKVMLSISPAV
jgi:hypothetical protein